MGQVKIMTDFSNTTVAGFGKVTFVPRNHTVPALPDMNLIVFKNANTFQAICIDIEVDAVGDNMKDACNNLKKALFVYTMQMVDNYKGNIKAAIEDIVNVAYSQGGTKSLLFTRYIQAKRLYLIDKIAKENKAKSRREDFINAWSKVFQFEPIRLNLTLASGIT
jgi:hypothetical protein